MASFLSPDVGPPPRASFSVLSPSARTSFTRVDISADAEVAGGDEADDSNARNDVEAGTQPAAPRTPQVALTFLLVSGRRRNMSFEPETTVGRVKELAWNAWPSEWQDERPPAPSYLRILYLGKILQDEDTLLKVGFPTHVPTSTSDASSVSPPPTIVHLSIRSQPPPGAKDTPKKMSLRRPGTASGDEGRSAGCCSGCIIA
ncbi:ubiquitin-related domain-containing protein [Cytidiella melzeri]|nr:ubiquitin-related domain-containing protein [Cytidiella melzeri]